MVLLTSQLVTKIQSVHTYTDQQLTFKNIQGVQFKNKSFVKPIIIAMELECNFIRIVALVKEKLTK